jgi:hypothetical protein
LTDSARGVYDVLVRYSLDTGGHMKTFQEKIQEFAALVETEQREVIAKRYPGINLDPPAGCCDRHDLHYRVKVTPGKVYVKVDFDGSGKYMVEIATGIIYGIKGYGKVHKGHRYGTLDTINQWHWGEYAGHRKQVA